MPNYSKPTNFSSGMSGPGVTLGMRKPRIQKIHSPKKFATPKDMKLGALSKPTSYLPAPAALPKMKLGTSAKPTSYLPTLAAGGKVISSKQN